MTPKYRWPAEWERHDATWIAWPHHEADWPGKFAPIPWVYAEIVRALHTRERVEILVNDERIEADARAYLNSTGIDLDQVRFHRQRTDRSWLRDSAPTGVQNERGEVVWMNWAFNAWAKYENFDCDQRVGECIERVTGLPRIQPARPETVDRGPVISADGLRSAVHGLVLEGGGLETDGEGTLLVTEEWLLSDVQVRNRGMSREDYERAFTEYLGISKTVWLGEGCVGDDTHGHIDDIARFVAPGVVLLAHEEDSVDENHRRSADNLARLSSATDAKGRAIEVRRLPFPRAVTMDGVRLPASYANFYIANGVVLVPTFNDPNDRIALNTIAGCFPGRSVTGIHAVDLVWGLGTIHCLTQQQPAPLSAPSSS